MLRYKVFFSAIWAAVLLCACGGADQNMKKGERYLALGEYFDAANEFKQAYSKTPPKERNLRGQRAHRLADTYVKFNQTQKAIAAYRNAIRYKQDSTETHLAFARQLLRNGNYKEAAAEFQMVMDSLRTYGANMTDDPRAILARNGLKSAQKAPEWKKQGSRYSVKRMDIFNSRRADYSPMLCGDEYDQLYFTSTRNEAQGDELSGITGTKSADIFFAQKDDKGHWQRPQAIESGLNSEHDEGACSFAPDQRTMYLTQCATDPQYPRYATIMTSNRSDAAWSKPNLLEISKDTLSSFAHPAISPDGQWLYFTSDMPGGQGGLDIWRTRLTSSGTAGVENLGTPINTPGDEMFPTFRPNGDLYFSSDGHPGMGGLDIFIAKADAWGKVTIEHPGYPLNSQGDEFGMTFEGMRNRGYFCTNRGDGRSSEHIYWFENPEIVQTVKGWVYEMEAYELPAAQIYMVGSDGTNRHLSVKGDGSFETEVQPGVEYLFLATCKGYLNHKEELVVEQGLMESKEHVLQFPLAYIGVPVLIDNIFYDFDKATLRPESATALDELVKMLNENPNITIELSAHTDCRGSDTYNKRLSQRRAETVVNYLIAHGIPADRLTPVGYGEERPKTIRKKITEKYPWMKENDQLTEEYINALGDNEKQETCHQLNRRTEFTVLRTTYGMFDEKGNLKNPPKARSAEPTGSSDDDFYME